jgi:hypothetical protein
MQYICTNLYCVLVVFPTFSLIPISQSFFSNLPLGGSEYLLHNL